MEKKWTKQHFMWHFLPIAAFFIWGALCVTNNLWYDEAYSASMVSLPWLRLLYVTAVDDHSPFYYVLLKLFYHLCGGGTHFFALKIMSLLFMMGYMLLGKYYVKKLFDEKISVYFMLFSVLMPIMTVQAGNVRMYAAALFFLTLTGLSAYDIFLTDAEDKTIRKKWVIFCLASICTVYCHTFALIQTFLFYLLFMGALLYSKQRGKIKPFFKSGIVVSIIFSPWLLVTCRQMLLRMRYDTGSVQDRPTIYTFVDYCKEWFSAYETPIGIVMFLGMAMALVLGYFAVDWMRANHNYAPAVGAGALGLTALSGALISVYINNCFMGRYAFPGFGFLMLFYAVGMSQISSKKFRIGILAAAALCFVLQYRSELALEYDKGLDTYEAFIDEEFTEDDVIIGPYTHSIFLNVYHPELQYYLFGYKLYSLPFANTDALLEWYQLDDVQGNIWYITMDDREPEQMAERYDYEVALQFHYMYYDFWLYRLTPKH